MTGVFDTSLRSADGGRVQGTVGSDQPYLAHFGLREEPFPAAASARAYFLTSASYQVLEGIRAALASGTALLRVCGGDGVGKSLLAAMVPSVMTPEMEPVSIDAALLGPDPFAVVLRRALGMPDASPNPLGDMLPFLATARDKNVSPVLVIDNAHLLGAEALQTLDRLLTPADPVRGVLMQVVLIGLPPLESLLNASGFARLRRAGGYAAELVPFTRQEATDYIGYRVRKAQAQSRPHDLFDDLAVQRVVTACCGNPRVLNVTCEAALLIAYADGADRVLKAHVDRAIEGAKMPSRLGHWLTGPRVSWAAGIAGVLIGAGVTAALITRDPFSSPSPVLVAAHQEAASPAATVPDGAAAPAPSVSPAPSVALTSPVVAAVTGASATGASSPTDSVASAPSGGDGKGAAQAVDPNAPGEDGATGPKGRDVTMTDVADAGGVSAHPTTIEAEVIRGRTVKPHREKVVETAVEKPVASAKVQPEKPVTEKAASEKPAPEKAVPEKVSAEKVSVEKATPDGMKPVAQKAAAVKPPPIPAAEQKPPAPKPPASKSLAPVPSASQPQPQPSAQTVAAQKPPAPPVAPAPSSAGASASRQENGRWVWQ